MKRELLDPCAKHCADAEFCILSPAAPAWLCGNTHPELVLPQSPWQDPTICGRGISFSFFCFPLTSVDIKSQTPWAFLGAKQISARWSAGCLCPAVGSTQHLMTPLVGDVRGKATWYLAAAWG